MQNYGGRHTDIQQRLKASRHRHIGCYSVRSGSPKRRAMNDKITSVTCVTRWRVPVSKCTRRYGAISADFYKNPEHSHAEHHKRMGTRLSSNEPQVPWHCVQNLISP